MSPRKNGRVPIVFSLSLLLAFGLRPPAEASSRTGRETFTFTKNREQDVKKLSDLCFLNDLTSSDVLWANDLTADKLTEGTVLVIPASRKDMLPVWQLVQKRRKSASDTLVSVKLHGVPRTAPKATPPEAAKAPSPSPSPATASSRPRPQGIPPAPAKTPKPDTSQKSGRTDAKEPLLLLAPDGDSANGPMRLVISGDNVAVVRLPRTQVPRTPGVSGLQRGIFPESSAPERIVPKNPKFSGSRMLWPVDGAVSSGFGKRGRRAFHAGIDIPMPKGTPIRAARDGVVKQAVSAKSRGFKGYGNVMVIDHGNGLSTLYAHCLTIKVKQGQRVRQGETIGTVGRTGRATTHHVHFEVRLNGKPVDPIPYLLPRR